MAKKTKKEVNTDNINEGVIDITDVESNKETTGLGDVIESVTSFLGIETCAECEERRKKLNKMFPFTKNAKEITNEEDKEFIRNLKERGKLSKEEVNKIMELMNTYFGMKVKFCNCPGLFKGYIEKLKVQLTYSEDV